MTKQEDLIALAVEDFTWKRRRGASTAGEGDVVPGIELAAMLHDAANDLVAEVFGVPDLESLSALAIRPVLREITAVFDAALTPGAPVFVGATLGSLSQRSFALKTGVWTAQGRTLIAHGSAAFVVVDEKSRSAVAVPGNVAEALHSLRPMASAPAEPFNNPTT
ncbi:acyl-CoA thioesterase [Mycolicibacterium sp. XJ879]